MKRISVKALLVACSLLLGASALAQNDPNQAAAQAQALFESGQNAEAAKAYAQLLQDFPTAPIVPEAQFRLGYLDFVLGDYDKGIALLSKLVAPPTPPELQQMAGALLPQLTAAKASKLSGAAQTAAFEEAIRQYDAYLQKFPKGDEVESVTYGRALASFQIRKFDDAAQALRRNLTQFPTSETILDSQYLLGLTLATQANFDLRSDNAAAKQAAPAKMAEAQKFFADIVSKKTDIALANQAAFQLGETFMNLAGFSAKDQQPDLYQKAIAAYHLVQGRDAMIAAQKARLSALLARIRQSAGNKVLYRHLQSVQQTESTKLAQIQSGPDQTIEATIKIGEIYFLQNDPNAARVVLHYVQPFVTSDDDQKQVLYYLALTYATQNLADQAVQAYDAFQAKYKRDPIAENLPFVIGSLFVAKDPQKAISYFKEALDLYPNSRFAPDILAQQAAALFQLQQFDQALGIYRQFLSKNPKPELAVMAEFGMAEIYRQTNKLDDAVTQYKKVSDAYPNTPQAEQAAFYIAQLTLQKGDAKTAIADFDAFQQKYPQSQLLPAAMFIEAQALQAAGERPKALQMFKDITAKFPKTDIAETAYFQVAQAYAADQKTDDMLGVMKEFIEKYPDSKNLIFAYDSIGQTLVSQSKIPDAIATYVKMVDDHPKNPGADQALYKAADLSRQFADSQGRYLALNDDQRKAWTKGVEDSVQYCERLLKDYPESANAALALQALLKDQQMFVDAKVKTEAQVEQYFNDLAEKFADQPANKSKVQFALASFLYTKDKAKALALMKSSYDAKFVYAPADMDLYGSALINEGKTDDALAVFQKLAADYPNPTADPKTAPPLVQEAQATALYGQGHALQVQGKVSLAAQKFDALKALYPWSPKLLEASYGLALSDFNDKKYDDASSKLVAIIRAQTATADLRANAMLLSAKIQEAKGNTDAAIDQYAKIATFYQSVRDAAAEGLWKAAQLIEQTAANITDPAKKTAQLAKAKAYYQQLADNYPESSHAAEAKQHATAQ